MTEIVRYAFIGAGSVAHLHAEALQRIPNARLCGVWSRGEEKKQAFAERFGAKAYPDLEALLADPEIDAVAVLVYSGAIAKYGLQCLEAGKHVLLEKPIAESVEEIAALKEAAARVGRCCMPSHNYVYAPDLTEAKRRIDAGDFGRLSSFWLLYNQKHPSDIGFRNIMTRDVMIHHAYASIYFAGRPRRVTATASCVHFDDGVSPDQVMAVAEHYDGTISNLWASFGVDDFSSSPWNVYYKILGTRGGFQKNWNDLTFGEPYLPGWDKAAYRDSFFHVHDFFVNRHLASGERPLSDLDDARDAFLLIAAIEQALETGRSADLAYG